MSEHTHLSGIKVNGDEITFSFSQHEGQAVAGLSVPEGANADRLGEQLKALAAANAITHEQAQEVAERSGLSTELYKPEAPKKDEVAADATGVVGDKTAAYLASKQAAQADAGMSV